MDIILRTQTEVLDDIKNRVRDTNNDRWTSLEKSIALNDALLTWHGRVSIPHIYTISGGWVAGTYEYDLPDYIDANAMQPQMKNLVPWGYYGIRVDVEESETWIDITGWTVEPTATNTRKLRFDISPYSVDARIIWWGRQGPLPSTIPTLSSDMTASDTTLTIGSTPTIHDYGWVKIDSEWIQYAGVTRGTSTTTLNNLVRAQNNTTAATHSNGANVTWGVAAHRQDLLQQLYDQARAYLHEMYLATAGEQERDLHERMVSYYQQKSDLYWRRYVPVKMPRIVIDRRMVPIG